MRTGKIRLLYWHSFKELFKYPKTERYNKSDLITNPKEIKPLLEYLQKPGNTDKKVRFFTFIS
jgi:hypothetical protein